MCGMHILSSDFPKCFWQVSDSFHHFEVGLKMFQQHLGDDMSPGPNQRTWHLITKFTQYVGFQLRMIFIFDTSTRLEFTPEQKAENTNHLTVINLSLSTSILLQVNDGWNIDPRTRFNVYDYHYPLVKKRSYIWNILMFNRKYISSKGPFSTAMLVYQSVFWLTYFFWKKNTWLILWPTRSL